MPNPWTAPKQDKPKRRFRPLAMLWGLLMGLATFMGLMFMIGVVGGVLFSSALIKEERLPDKIILTLRLTDGLIEAESGKDLLSSLENFGEVHLTLRDIVEALNHGARDPRVKGVAFSLEAGDFGVANVQELRAAIKNFRAAGKPAWVFSPSYAEAGGGMGTYYLAASFDQIWMQPIGMVGLPGIDAEMPFMADALLKIGVRPEFMQRKEYKSVMENLSRNSMSPENREMMTSLLTDITGVMVSEIAADRKIAAADVSKMVDRGVFTDVEAKAAKLVDHIDYSDAMLTAMRGQDPALKLVPMENYSGLTPLKDEMKAKPQIGLISAVGEIVADTNRGFSNTVVTPADITGAFDEAIRDSHIKAIVFRVASPGGSPTASESIRRSVQVAVSHGKPVIVSMGAMAGSGGYWIVADATRIFAVPATLTGSIGVASGKVDASELMKKLSINWDGIQIGTNADMNSMTKPFSASGLERMNAIMDSIYNGFVSRVAAGRKMTPEAVEKIAKGRVWTGRQAQSIGLVDEIGGLEAALNYTAKSMGLNDYAQLDIVSLPREKPLLEQVLDLFNIKVMTARMADVAMETLGHTVRAAATPGVRVYDPVLRQDF